MQKKVGLWNNGQSIDNCCRRLCGVSAHSLSGDSKAIAFLQLDLPRQSRGTLHLLA